jgi:hypothetical protein
LINLGNRVYGGYDSKGVANKEFVVLGGGVFLMMRHNSPDTGINTNSLPPVFVPSHQLICCSLYYFLLFPSSYF